MEQKYESYEEPQNTTASLRDGYSWGQTFTPQVAHRITSVRLYMFKVGNPPDQTVHISATSAGKPSGPDLAVGTITAAMVETSFGWVEIPLDEGADLDADAMYAMYFSSCPGDMDNQMLWGLDNEVLGYLRGHGLFHPEWTIREDREFLFQEWGVSLVLPWRGKGIAPGMMAAGAI